MPRQPVGLVVFAHGAGSGRHSPRNRLVAEVLQKNRIGTLLVDLSAPNEPSGEAAADLEDRVERWAGRLMGALAWARRAAEARPLGLAGSGDGGSAAIVAAARRPGEVKAVVLRGARPDCAGPELRRLRVPTLFVVGGADDELVGLNRLALTVVRGEARLELVPGATHLFEEPGAIDRVAVLTADWFTRWFGPRAAGAEAR